MDKADFMNKSHCVQAEPQKDFSIVQFKVSIIAFSCHMGARNIGRGVELWPHWIEGNPKLGGEEILR